MEQFNYFITFYSIVLGLAVTELLSGFARIVRARALRKLEAQTALVAILTFVMLMTSWVDGWITLKSVTIDFAGLWAPILMAILYYLAAAVIFPHDEADHERLADYYRERRPFIIGMLVMCGLFTHFIYRHLFTDIFEHQPAVFWLWIVPYNAAIDASTVALVFLSSRRWNIVLLTFLILLMVVPYWDQGLVRDAIARRYGYV